MPAAYLDTKERLRVALADGPLAFEVAVRRAASETFMARGCLWSLLASGEAYRDETGLVRLANSPLMEFLP